MPATLLNISLIQPDMVWENKQANLSHYETLIGDIQEQKEIVVLPEMFSTGFSMSPERLAEPMDGPSVQWMKEQAARHRCILSGSLIIEEAGHYYNRLIWMQPNGKYGIYDKRHLFGYAHENAHFSAGGKRLIASVKGWRINLMVCYDLRFPLWARQMPAAPDEERLPGEAEYDVLIYVANWPERRSLAWKTLLQARAIENMSYVVGVNRVGKDGKDINYTGDSSVFGPLGEAIWQRSGEEAVHTVTLDKEHLMKTRSELPFLKDADRFMLL